MDRPWSRNFLIDGETNRPIKLSQTSEKFFLLRSQVIYQGETGLENRDYFNVREKELRKVTPELLEKTDLASVPQWFLWFVRSYGVYTPAAIVHDRLMNGAKVGTSIDGVSAQDADRYFRFMLHSLEVPLTRRWLMWNAVAFRTRLYDGFYRRLSMVLWIVLALLGVVALFKGIATSDSLMILGSVLLPIPASLLWGRQISGGLIAAYLAFPWVFPVSLLAWIFYMLYGFVERILSYFDSPL